MVLEVVFRALTIYIAVLVVMRLMGKREIGQLSTFDLVVAIMIAELAVLPMEDLSIPLYIGLLPMFVLVGAEILLSYLCLHSRFLRGVVDGAPSVLISNGKIMEREMRRQRYNINDLLGQLREKNVFNISDVHYAILETSGELSVIVKPSKRPLTVEDLSLAPPAEDIPVSVIIDGEVLVENLSYLGLAPGELENTLHLYGVHKEDVIYASIDSEGRLYVSEKGEAERRKKESETEGDTI